MNGLGRALVKLDHLKVMVVIEGARVLNLNHLHLVDRVLLNGRLMDGITDSRVMNNDFF